MGSRWRGFGAFVVCAALGVTDASAGSSALERGEIDLVMSEVKGSGVPRATVKGLVDASVEDVWAVVSDCRRSGKLFEGVYAIKRHSHSGGSSVCSSKFSMPFPFSDLKSKMKYRTEVTASNRRVSWRLVAGDFTRSTGSWVVTPYEGSSTRTLVEYTSHAEPNIPVPGWLQEQGLRDTIPSGVRNLRKVLGR